MLLFAIIVALHLTVTYSCQATNIENKVACDVGVRRCVAYTLSIARKIL